MSGLFLILIALIIVIALGLFWHFWLRHRLGTPNIAAFGTAPEIPAARPQGMVPTLKMPTAKGWENGAKPTPAQGLKVEAFATELDHPRMVYVLPNGDVLVAESSGEEGRATSIVEAFMHHTMRRAGAMRPSADRITILRDADGDGVPELREAFLENQLQPFGMALVDQTLYVGNTDAVMAFPYEHGQTSIEVPGRKILDLKPSGHWTRNLIASKDGTKLYVAVGSLSNIADSDGGFETEEGRACIYEIDLKTEESRIFGAGLRNPVGMAFEPTTDKLYTVVNERDGLGDETPPDYLTSVKEGGFYGWPYAYWGPTVDERVQPQNPELVSTMTNPDYALGGHTASLGLCWAPAGTLPGLPEGMVIGQHGSWNRSKLSGYKFILVPFENGQPSGPSHDVLTGFLAPDEKFSNGRPVGVAIAKDGALLAVDDVGNTVWRVTAA